MSYICIKEQKIVILCPLCCVKCPCIWEDGKLSANFDPRKVECFMSSDLVQKKNKIPGWQV